MVKDQDKIKKYLNIAKGQLDGIIKMVEDDRYCLDVLDQINATTSLLKKTNNLILKNHLQICVKNAIKHGDDDKLEEVIKTLEKQI